MWLGISSFVPKNPLMTRNPKNCYIFYSGKGGNGLIAITNQFGFDHARVQRHQRCLTVHAHSIIAATSARKTVGYGPIGTTSSLHDLNPRIPALVPLFCFKAVYEPFELRWWKRFPSL
ncbi:hypothetical protein J6590_002343 [Homalodisca vitripennis]|nr:hypothetical protein J6590_002343 [Homalodisca vitripennis]